MKTSNFWCRFGIHEWLNWNEIETMKVTNAYLESKTAFCQTKKCKKCNLTKIRVVK